jgi:nickel-dependent lactate racemase
VLIIIDDATRATPTARILPLVIRELHAAGVSDNRIEFIQGLGTHRPMKPDELKKKLGELNGKYKVHEHHYKDRSSLAEFGKTRDGTPVTANKLLTQFDFITGIGSILPHRVKGFSGGAKLAFPGAAGKEMMERNQWEASMHMSETVMGVPENPMRLRMEEAARLAGFHYIINVVYEAAPQRTIVGCFVGDVVSAHREGCKCSREVYAVHLPSRADIVLIDSHSADRDFWQSAKAPYAGTMAVKDGGSMICVAPNPEGVASNHDNLLKIGPHAEIVRMVQQGKVDDLIGVAILADVCQIIDKTDCIMVSPGVKPEEAAKIGFRYARTAQEALQMALDKQGKSAKVAVLRYGGHILPIVDDEAAERNAGGT